MTDIEKAGRALARELTLRGFVFENTTQAVELDGGGEVEIIPEYFFHALMRAVRDAPQ